MSSIDRPVLDSSDTKLCHSSRGVHLDQLCIDYAQRPAELVLSEATDWLRQLERIRNEKHLTLTQTTDVYDLTGWLALLVSCLRYDTGDERGAERMRRLALALGEELHSPAILGWATKYPPGWP